MQERWQILQSADVVVLIVVVGMRKNETPT